MLEKAEPYYEGTIIKHIGIKTQFKDGTVETDFNIGFIPIEPYVEFDKIVYGKKMYSINEGKESIEIEKMGINLELFLQRVEGNGFSFDMSLKLADKEAYVSDISLSL